ncbi:unnamed protein product [Knipowitschia caucasica]
MEAPPSPSETISIVVKSPNQLQEDQTINGVNVNWTVKDLKLHLSAVYPSKPALNEQRLIYSGKLLPDHLHIRDFFRQTDFALTLHLVCAVKSTPQPTMAAHSIEPGTSHASPSVSASTSGSQDQTVPELRQRRAPVPPTGAPEWTQMHGGPAMTPPSFPTYTLYSPQQLLWLQHVYARHYYMQYHAALAAASTGPQHQTSATIAQYPPVPAPHQVPVPVPAPLANQNPIDNLPANQNPAPDAAFIDPGVANQNMRMNAQGGPVMEDEEDIERDWLDWFYSAARLGVLLMIVYFNSNLSRFLLVMGMLFFMYMHTMGWFPFRRRALPIQPPNPPQGPQNQNPEPAADEVERPGDDVSEENSDAAPERAVLVPPHPVSAVWTAWVFLKTFFSSLIPEVHHAAAN